MEAAPYTLDDDLIHAAEEGGEPQLRVLSYPGVDVVLGGSSKPDEELHVDAVRADGVPVLRRRGGGCAVVLDPGNIVVSVVLPLPGLSGIKTAFAMISDWLIDGLTGIGLDGISKEGISDLALGDRKVGGSCVYRTRGVLYYSATLLVDPDVARIERYLKHPPREPAYREGRPHAEFVGSLKEMLGPVDGTAFALELGRILRDQAGGLERAENRRSSMERTCSPCRKI